MNAPRRFLFLPGAAHAFRALCRMILGLLPASSNQRRASVTRDEIAALFAADLSRDRKHRS